MAVLATTAKPLKFRQSLRNSKINYRNGWFFVTVQVARNKSVFGSIVGERCVLNDFGRAVAEYWAMLPEKYPELEIFEWVLMPNHFHALLRVHYRETNREHHLGFLMSRFKGGTGFLYGKFKREGFVEDFGEHLWQRDYWDNLVTSDEEFVAIAKYIRENPANWSRDRYGVCTSYHLGNIELLNAPRIAFVASQGFFASELKPKRIWAKGRGPTEVGPSDGDARHVGPSDRDARQVARHDRDGGGVGGVGDGGEPVVISTFTSAQEREALRRALAKGRRVVQVAPAGIPAESELSPELLATVRAGRALILSPQPTGGRLNKKVATWCNEYVLRHADEIWVGDLAPNGSLRAMLEGLGKERAD